MKFSTPGFTTPFCFIALLLLWTFPLGAAAETPQGADSPTAADEAAERLPEIVVSASRTPLEARAAGSAVTVITAEELERKQVRVLSDVLREVPGVAVSRLGTVGAQTQVRIRGAEGNHTLVLIDGVEVNDPSGGSEFDFGDLLAADVERVEVLRGPQSALYGSDAIGGVINVITRKGRGPGAASLRLEGGSFGSGEVSAGIRGAGERYHFALGGTGYRTSGVSIGSPAGGKPEKDGYRSHGWRARLGAGLLEDLDVELLGRYVRSKVETDTGGLVGGFRVPVDGDDETRATRWSGRARLTYSLFDGAWEHRLGAGTSRKKRGTFSAGSRTYQAEGVKSRFDYQTSVFFDTEALADAAHSFTLLAEREKDSQGYVSSFGSGQHGVTGYGYTGEYRVGVWERLFLSGSVRFDDNDRFRDAATFRATAAYLFEGSGTRLHGSYGAGVKNPTLFELFGFASGFTPNPRLTPEKSNGWDAGIEQSLLDRRLTVDVTYFDNRIRDHIGGYFDASTGTSTSVNLDGVSEIRGVETTLKARVTPALTLTGQYTWTDARDPMGMKLTRRARRLASAHLAWEILDGRAELGLGVRYNGQQQDIRFGEDYSRSRVTLDDFVLVNLTASYETAPGVELFGRVENLLDQDYQEVFGYRSTGIGGFLGVRWTLEPLTLPSG